MPCPKIVIVGAGPGGLTLARLLQQNNLPCTIYEAEKDRNNRNQGGSLDLNPNTGQRALKEAGLLPEFERLSRPEGDCDKLVTYDGTVLWNENEINLSELGVAGVDPEIDRVALRDMLLDSLRPGTVQWAHKVTGVEADPSAKTKYTIHFADGSKESDVDLLVGADGAWSKVRPLVTDQKPFYSGVTMVELWALNVGARNPALSQFVGAGTCFMFDEGRAIIAQRNGHDGLRTYAAVRRPETWKDECGIDWTAPDAARAQLVRDYFADCAADLQRAVRESRDALLVRPLYMLPVGLAWPPRPGVTLLGDAAHLMTPFAGVGVNVALLDALTLAHALIARRDGLFADASAVGDSVAAAVREYEDAMFVYARENAEKTAHGLKNHFRADGGEERAARYKMRHEALLARRRAEVAGANSE